MKSIQFVVLAVLAILCGAAIMYRHQLMILAQTGMIRV